MASLILSGTECSRHIKTDLAHHIQKLKAERSITPGLAVIQVGEDPASKIYVQRKREACTEVGIQSFAYDLPPSTSQQELIELIEQLNINPQVHGILVQLPLPKHLDENLILEKILPEKDVDAFHPYNLGRLAQRRPSLRPCTPFGIMKLLDFYQLTVKGKHVVVVGASNIVGRPASLEFLLAGATVTTCHRFTQNLAHFVQQADILVVAVGKREIVQAEWIKPGAIVIDVGIHRLSNGSLCGDLNFQAAQKRASAITPVPGGVGPMTVAMLMYNTVQACHHINCIEWDSH